MRLGKLQIYLRLLSAFTIFVQTVKRTLYVDDL